MAWSIPLQNASFKSVAFEIFSIDETNSKSLIEHAYPYVNGADIEDMGLNAHSISMSAVYYGTNFNIAVRQLLDALNSRGSGVLIHPVNGRIVDMMVESYSVRYSAEDVNYVIIDLSFKKSKTGKKIFTADYGEIAQIDRLLSNIELFTSELSFYIERLLSDHNHYLLIMSVINNTVADIYSVLNVFNDDNKIKISSVVNISNVINPIFDEVITNENILFNQLLQTRKTVKNQISVSLKLLDAREKRKLKTILPLLELAIDNSVTQVLSSKLVESLEIINDNNEINPVELAKNNNEIRSVIQQSIDSINAYITDYEVRYILVNSFRTQAHDINQLVAQLINKKPPLQVKLVNENTTLYQLAHQYYKDFMRADELLSLNSHIRHPSFIKSGELINAFRD